MSTIDYVTQRQEELQAQFDQLTARVEAVQKDLGRERDSEQKLILNQRLQDLLAERERVVEQMAFLDQHADEIRAGKLDLPGLPEIGPLPGPEPYKGLQYFDLADADNFFGREALTAELAAHIRQHSLLAVVGASGSGKSSLVRAGLVYALEAGQPLADGSTPPEGSTRWPLHVITPTARPLESLAASLTRDSESVTATATLIDDLAGDPRSLHLYARRLLSGPGAGERLLLVVDQFEELFTLCKDKAQRRAFVDNLLAAACPEPDGCSPAGTATLVVLTLRADFYAQCAEFDSLRTALERYQRYIGAMSQDELRRAIEAPAQRGGWELEPGLVDVLLQDVGDEPGALPLLSQALLETWKRRRGRTLTLAGYAASGRVQGAIARTADDVYQHRLTPEQQPIARNIFLRLTELGEGAPDTRRRVASSEVIPQGDAAAPVEAVLKTLADARLVTTFQSTVEVAHEALIREWPTLQEWLTDDREALRIQRRLTVAAHEWEQNGRDDSYLYRGSQLAQTGEWAGQHAGDLNLLERSFLVASQALRNKDEEEREEQRQRELAAAQRLVEAERLRAEDQARFLREVEDALARAERLARRAQAGELAAYAQTSAAKNLLDPSESLLLADLAMRATWTTDGYVTANAAHAAVDAIEAAPPWRLTLPRRRHTAWVSSAAFDPAGQRIVTASDDQTARVWDAASGEELLQLRGHTDRVSSAAFDPAGQRIVTASDDQTARVWPTTVEALLALVESLIQRDPPLLTPEERRRFGLE